MVVLILALMEGANHIAEVKDCIEGAGHEVCLVDSFARAMAILKDHSFDLIISDVHLENGGSVFDFLKWVKGNDEFRSIPFVLFSLEPNRLAKYLADGVRAASRQMGAAKYISMDQFDAAFLSREIAELLPCREQNVSTVLPTEGY